MEFFLYVTSLVIVQHAFIYPAMSKTKQKTQTLKAFYHFEMIIVYIAGKQRR